MLESLRDLFEEQIKDLYNAENQLVKALPRMAKHASTESLRNAFQSHLEETKEHVERLAAIAEMMEFKPSGKVCKAMKGLLEEGKEVFEEEGDEAVIDAALVAAAQRVEHYEISAYGTAKALAERLGARKAASLLDKTLEEEKAADVTLTEVCVGDIFSAAPQGAEA